MTVTDHRPSKALRAMAVRRVLLALSRFGAQVRKVTVRLAEPANPMGGVDQRCRMRAWLLATDHIHAEAINGRIEAAVARAAARLARRVGSALDGASSDGFRGAAPTPPRHELSAPGRPRTRVTRPATRRQRAE